MKHIQQSTWNQLYANKVTKDNGTSQIMYFQCFLIRLLISHCCLTDHFVSVVAVGEVGTAVMGKTVVGATVASDFVLGAVVVGANS